MKKRVLLSITAVIIGFCLLGTAQWVEDTTSRIELVTGGKTCELIEKWVWDESFGRSASSAWFPTSITVVPGLAKELDEFTPITYSDDMTLRFKSFFRTRILADQSFSLYDQQLKKTKIRSFDGLASLPSGQYYLVVDAMWGLSFNRTGYQHIGKIILP
jgi:hypothetical protein